MTISLVVPAAGCGARAALNGNKILAPLNGRPVLWWTLRGLTQNSSPDKIASAQTHEQYSLQPCEVVIAARDDERAAIKAIWGEVGSSLPLRFAVGGATRQQSVAAAVRLCQGDLVAVHDAARPLITPELLNRVALAAAECGAAIPALPASDTVKRAVSYGELTVIEETLERGTIWLAQTPQIFRRDLLLEALAFAEADGFDGTDCAGLVERLPRHQDGRPQQLVAIVPGESRNFKITYAADLNRAAALM